MNIEQISRRAFALGAAGLLVPSGLTAGAKKKNKKKRARRRKRSDEKSKAPVAQGRTRPDPVWVEICNGQEVNEHRGPTPPPSVCGDGGVGPKSHARNVTWGTAANLRDHSVYQAYVEPAGEEWDRRTGSLVIDYHDRDRQVCRSLDRHDGSIALTVCPGFSDDYAGETRLYVDGDRIIAAKVWIYIGPDDPEFYPTIVHEIGHAIGLNHNPDPNSVMYADATDDPYFITAHDCEALGTLNYQPGSGGCAPLASEPILWP